MIFRLRGRLPCRRSDRISGEGRTVMAEEGATSFAARTVTVAPGDSRPHDEDEWQGTLVVVESGEIELRCRAGGRRRFAAGAVLWFTGLNLASVHNPGDEPAVFRGISRGRGG